MATKDREQRRRWGNLIGKTWRRITGLFDEPVAALPRNNRRTFGRLLQLEDRALLSASTLDPQIQEALEAPTAKAQPEQFLARREVAFVDSAVHDFQTLIEQLNRTENDRQLDVVILDGNRNGIEQITQTLAGYQNLDAVHFLSHGSDGAVKLGSMVLDGNNLPAYTDAIATWSAALGENADLYFYGCDLAEGAAGQNLMVSLAGLTGADVAASTDVTGHASKGGDWDLEFSFGIVETQVALDSQGQQTWNGVFAPPTAVNNSYAVNEDNMLSVPAAGVLNNDSDPDGDPLTAVLLSDVSNGSLVLNANGSFTYTPNANFNGTDTFQYAANDGTSNSNTATVTITVNPVNDAPVNTVPASGSTNEDTPLVFSSGNGNQISISDVDAGSNSVQVTLTATNGTVTLNGTTGLSFSAGDGSADAIMTFSGTIANINAALNGLTFIPTAGFSGTASLQIVTNDLGNSGSGGAKTDTDSIVITVLPANVLWLTTTEDVASPSGAPGLDSWTSGQILEFGGLNVTYEPGTTSGTFSSLFNLDNFASDGDANVQAIHYVGSNITVGVSNPFSLLAGDVLLSTVANETLTSSNTLVVGGHDVLVFRPDSPGNYSSGSFFLLIDSSDIMPNNLQEITLVEQDTVVGDITLRQGDFLFVQNGNIQGNIVYRFQPNSLGSTTTGTVTTLIKGDDIDLGLEIDGLELVENTLVVGNTTLQSGQLLLSLSNDDNSVGDNGIATQAHDIFILTVFTTGANTSANATLFLDGSDVGLNTAAEDIDGLALVTLNVASNQDPVAVNDVYSVNEGATLSAVAPGVLTNDSDPDGDPLTAVLLTGPSYAAAFTLNADGSFSYTHDGSETTSDSFTYSLSDGNGGTATGTVSITVNPVNDAPLNNVPGVQVTPVNTSRVFSAGTANPITISDVDLGAGTMRMTLTATNGVLTLAQTTGLVFSAGDGTADAGMTFTGSLNNVNLALDGLSFAPNAAFQGLATVTVTSDDQGSTGAGGALTDTDTLNIQVGAAQFQQGNNGYSGTEDTELRSETPNIPFGNVDNVRIDLANPGGGISQGLIRFDNIFGSGPGEIPLGSTINSASLTVYVFNPSASSALLTLHRMVVTWSEASTWNSLTGGIQTDGSEALAAADSTQGNPTGTGFRTFFGLQGTVQAWSDGAANFGWAIVTNSSNGWQIRSSEYATASERPYLTIDYTPPQPPIIDLDADNSSGSAVADFNTTWTEGGGARLIADNDAIITDADDTNLVSMTVTITNLQDQGQESLSVNTGGTGITASYIPGQGVLTLSGNDTLANYQQVLRTIRYDNTSQTPDTTSRIITFVASDGLIDGNTATTTLTIIPINDAPVAVGESYSTNEDTPLSVAAPGVLANDSDVEGDPLTAVLVSGAANGTVVLNPDGSFTYTPNANFNGSDSFTYHANDGTANSNMATVTLTVNAINDAPVAVADSYNVNEDAVLNIASPGMLANDVDADGDPMTASLVSGTANGILTFNSDGSFTYTPNANFNGTDSFTYRASDGTANSNVATVTITVNPVNNAPVAMAESHVTDEDVPLIIAAPGVLANDTDIDGDALAAVLVSGPANGILSLNANGSLTYISNLNFNGTDSFTYRASDGTATSNVVTVTITINAINDAPVAGGNSYSVNEDTMLTIPAAGVLGNDSDVEATPLTAIVVSGPLNGILTLLADGSFTYAPNTNFNGSDSFTYKASDGAADSNIATVSLTINAVNDAPVRLGGVLDNLVVMQGSGLTSLGLNDLQFGPGGGADEAGQVVSIVVTAVPDTAVGDIVLADGVTVVATGRSYAIAQVRGMQFRATGVGGPLTFSLVARDSGGTGDGGVDLLAESLTVLVQPMPPAVQPPAAAVPPGVPSPAPEDVPNSVAPPVTNAPAEPESAAAGEADLHTIPMPQTVALVMESSAPASDVQFVSQGGGSSRLPTSPPPRGNFVGETSLTQFQVFDPVGAESRNATITSAMQIGLGLASASGLAVHPQFFWNQLNELSEQFEPETWDRLANATFLTGLTVSAGYLLWNMRTWYLLASLLLSRPLWQEFDHMAVLDVWYNNPKTRRYLLGWEDDEDEEKTLGGVMG